MTLFVSMLVCSFTFSGCSDEEPNTVQAEVVFADDVNLTKIDQWESSMELEQLGTNIPFEIRSNSEWEILFAFDDNCFCLAYPNKGVGNATVELCVFNNPTDERCTGKMYIVFPKDLGKSHIVQLSQKGNIDNDDNGTDIDNEPESHYHYLKCPMCKKIFNNIYTYDEGIKKKISLNEIRNKFKKEKKKNENVDDIEKICYVCGKDSDQNNLLTCDRCKNNFCHYLFILIVL